MEEKSYDWYRESIDEWFFGLDEAVINALNLYIKQGLPKMNLGNFSRPLVAGSGNAIETGKILFDGTDAVFATESTYEQAMETHDIDGAVLISASGRKDAPSIAEKLKEKGIKRKLLTCNPEAPAAEFFNEKDVYVFPSLPEPYTYNTSTYMGMILSKTKEDPQEILQHIKKQADKKITKTLGKKTSYTLLVDKKHSLITPMLQTKFIELFARRFGRDVFTKQYAEAHATDVVKTPGELYVSFGYENKKLGENRLTIPLPKDADYGAMMAVGYYFCGKLQEQKKPYFKEYLVSWAEERGRKPLVSYR
jgi:hypothetical protein